MATKDPFANLGNEFMSWQSAPSITQTLKGGQSPLLNLLGIALAGGGQAPEQPIAAPAMGQGISAPVAPPVGINPNAPSGVGIAPGSFQIPNLTLPQMGSPDMPAQGADIDGDNQVDDFWGVKTTTPVSSVDVNNRTDFNPLAPDTSNQFAVSGNAYQQVPGYGKLQKIAGQLMGMG